MSLHKRRATMHIRQIGDYHSQTEVKEDHNY